MYEYLIGQTVDDIFITEEIYQMAANRLIGLRRRKYKGLTDDEILEQHITEDDIKNGILPVFNIINKNNKSSQDSKPVKVSHTTIRNMPFALNDLIGYTETEKEFINQRINEYVEKITLTNPNDYFLVRQVVLYELSIEKINMLMVTDPLDVNGYQKKLNIIMDTYLRLCDSLNALKKQRDKGKTNTSGGLNIHETIQEISDKSIDEMELEKEEEIEEEKKMLRRKKNRE